MQTSPRHGVVIASFCVLTGLLAACGNDSPSTSTTAAAGNTTQPADSSVVVQPAVASRYDMANGCFVMRSVANNKLVSKDSVGTYSANVDTQGMAEPLYMKPTALGSYMLMAKNMTVMSAVNAKAGSQAQPTDASDWLVDGNGDDGYTVFLPQANKTLTVDPVSQQLVLTARQGAGDLGVFKFEKASGCSVYPEITTDIDGDTYKGNGVDQPAIGFADVHNHITATTFLGGVHYGSPFDKFGAPHALEDCAKLHGPNGTKDIVGNFLSYGTPIKPHDTKGWPTFADWPAHNSLSHEGTYYKWIERSYKAGLRLLVTDLVQNEVLCKLVSESRGILNPQCNEMETAVAQVQVARQLQDYVDAQEGGPGKGWFRIVTSPQEARKVINDGKLAVVLGVEISHLFNCNISNGVAGCTKATIDEQIDRLYKLGVRQMFPIHEFNNAFGGNGIFDGFVLNVGNKVDTGQFWETYDCPAVDYLYPAGATMTTVPGAGSDPLTKLLIQNARGQAPLYNTSAKQCNKAGLTELGKYAFQKLMDKKIIIEIDHLELSIKSALLDMAEAQKPNYPIVSTHGGHGGISTEQAKRIWNVGGIIYPYHNNGTAYMSLYKKIKATSSGKYPFAVGYGADTNGLGEQAGPRPAGSTPVRYPFSLFKGDGWSNKFARLNPLTVNRQKSGERIFDVNIDGQAHYGLKPDFIEELRLEAGPAAPEVLDALYDSAEVYLQMWERTLNR